VTGSKFWGWRPETSEERRMEVQIKLSGTQLGMFGGGSGKKLGKTIGIKNCDNRSRIASRNSNKINKGGVSKKKKGGHNPYTCGKSEPFNLRARGVKGELNGKTSEIGGAAAGSRRKDEEGLRGRGSCFTPKVRG